MAPMPPPCEGLAGALIVVDEGLDASLDDAAAAPASPQDIARRPRAKNPDVSPEKLASTISPFVRKRSFVLYSDTETVAKAPVDQQALLPIIPLAEAIKREIGTFKLGEAQLTKAMQMILEE